MICYLVLDHHIVLDCTFWYAATFQDCTVCWVVGGADMLVKKFRQSHLGHSGKSQVGHIGKKMGGAQNEICPKLRYPWPPTPRPRMVMTLLFTLTNVSLLDFYQNVPSPVVAL